MKYLYLRKVIKKQDILIDGAGDDVNEYEKKEAIKATEWIEENQIEIKKIVLASGMENQTKSYMQPLGLNYAREKHIRAIDNLAFLNAEIMGTGRQMVNRSKGYYKKQALKSFNPLFWIEFLVFLPREILKYFNVDDKVKYGTVITKILQIIYWIGSIIIMYLKFIKNEV